VNPAQSGYVFHGGQGPDLNDLRDGHVSDDESPLSAIRVDASRIELIEIAISFNRNANRWWLICRIDSKTTDVIVDKFGYLFLGH
jgi:hypothetical protein